MTKEDVVSVLQNQITRVTAAFFNFVGALQRDAPPADINGEALMQQPSQPFNLQEQVDIMARELREGIDDLKRAIEELPNVQGEMDAAPTAPLEAQQKDSSASATLQEKFIAAEDTLAHLYHIHGIVADLALKNSADTNTDTTTS